MANYYIYLIASLPSLSFGAKPPLSFGNFLKACEGLIPDEDMNIIRSAGNLGFNSPSRNSPPVRVGMDSDRNFASAKFTLRRSEEKDSTGVSPWSFNRAGAENATLKKWISFETTLRNDLVKLRSSRRKTDPAKYLRDSRECAESSHTAHIAMSAFRKPSIFDSEKALDFDRWRYLDELAIGRYFDLDVLIIYACKLLILEKWDKIQSAETHKILEEVLIG